MPIQEEPQNPEKPRKVEGATRVLRCALDEIECLLGQALDAVEVGGAESDLPPLERASLRKLLSGMLDSSEAIDELIEGAAARARRLRLGRHRLLLVGRPQ